MQKPFIGFLAVALSLALYASSLAREQQPQELTPYIGETKEQFEARKAGLPQPAARSDIPAVTISADPKGGFFVESAINDTPIRMMIDTGANYVALSESDARSAGIELQPRDFRARVATANGTVMVAPVLLKEVAVGAIVVNDIPAIVVPEGRLPVSLLGMSFLSKLSYFNETNGQLTLRR